MKPHEWIMRFIQGSEQDFNPLSNEGTNSILSRKERSPLVDIGNRDRENEELYRLPSGDIFKHLGKAIVNPNNLEAMNRLFAAPAIANVATPPKALIAKPESAPRSNKAKDKQRQNRSRRTRGLQGNINFSKTHIGHFVENKEMLIYSGGSFYVPGWEIPDYSMLKSIVFEGKKRALVHIGSAHEYEHDFLNKNEDEISRFVESSLESVLEQQNSLRQEGEDLRNRLSRKKSLDDFIENTFIPIYKRRKHKEESGQLNEDFEDIELSNIDESSLSTLSFKQITPSISYTLRRLERGRQLHGAVIFSNGAYGIHELINDHGWFDETIEAERLPLICSSSEFEREYQNSLKSRVRLGVEKKLDKNLREIRKGENSIREQERSARDPIENFKELHFDKYGDKEYVVYINFPRHIVKKDNNYYLFQQVKLGTDVVESHKNCFQVSNHVFVYKNPDFDHPFVSGSGDRRKVCYHHSNDQSHLRKMFGIGRGSISSPENAAKLMATNLISGPRHFRNHFYKSLQGNVYSSIEDSSAKKISKREADSYESRGVNIFDGDKPNGR